MGGGAFDDGRRLTPAEFSEDGARGETADRAVAPLVMDGEGGVGDAEMGRLDGGAGRGGAVVAMLWVGRNNRQWALWVSF